MTQALSSLEMQALDPSDFSAFKATSQMSYNLKLFYFVHTLALSS